MPTPKARFLGLGGPSIKEEPIGAPCRDEVRAILLKHTMQSCQPTDARVDRVGNYRAFRHGFGDETWRQAVPEDHIAERLVAEAMQVKIDLAMHESNTLSVGEVGAEYRTLERALGKASFLLGRVSDDVRRGLGPDAELEELAQHCERVRKLLISRPPAAKRPPLRVFQGRMVKRLIESSAEILIAHGIPVSGRGSPLIAIVVVLGEAVGLKRDEPTWRNAISRMKRPGATPD